MLETERLAVEWTKAQRPIGAFLRAMVTDFHEAEDLLQKVAVTVAQKFGQYDPSRPFLPWAMGIAKLEVREYRRRSATSRLTVDTDIVERVAATFEEIASEGDARRIALRRCLKKIFGRALEALQLRYTHDERIDAIATRLDMTPGAVRVMLHRSRDQLRQCIEKNLREWDAE